MASMAERDHAVLRQGAGIDTTARGTWQERAFKDAFSATANTARVRQEQLTGESRKLAAQRDALLPGLVSGEVKVGEVT